MALTTIIHQYLTESICEELKVHRKLDRQTFRLDLAEGPPFQMTIVVLSPVGEMCPDGISRASLKIAVKLEHPFRQGPAIAAPVHDLLT